jgi:hypothetical protein
MSDIINYCRARIFLVIKDNGTKNSTSDFCHKSCLFVGFFYAEEKAGKTGNFKTQELKFQEHTFALLTQ